MPIGTVRNLRAILQCIATFGGCQSDAGNSNTLINIANLRIGAHISYQHDFIHSLYLHRFARAKIRELEILAFSRRELATAVDALVQVVNNTIIAVLT